MRRLVTSYHHSWLVSLNVMHITQLSGGKKLIFRGEREGERLG